MTSNYDCVFDLGFSVSAIQLDSRIYSGSKVLPIIFQSTDSVHGMYREPPQRLNKANVDMHSSKSQEPTIVMAGRTLGFTLKGFPCHDWLRRNNLHGSLH